MNCSLLAKEILREIDETNGAKNPKAAEQFLAKKLKSLFDAETKAGEDTIVAIHLDCGVPKSVFTSRKDLLDARIVFLDDPSILDDDKIDAALIYEDRVVLDVLKPELLYNPKTLADVVDSVK